MLNNRQHLSSVCFIVLTLGLALQSEIKPGFAASLSGYSVVADGLNNVRGLSFAPDGSLYITEAGVGGDLGCVSGHISNLPVCGGTSGSITRVKDGNVERILTGLPSIALRPSGSEGQGPQDIQFDASGNAYLLIGYGGNAKISYFGANSPTWGQLYKADLKTGSLSSIADLAKYELVNNPDKEDTINSNGEIPSNPFGFTISGNTAYIVDAAGNDLLSVGLDGSNLKTVAIFPKQKVTSPVFPAPPGQLQSNSAPTSIEIQSVPTGVVKGSDGALYVSELTGFPFPSGSARLFRVETDGKVTVYADGFTQLTDLDFDSSGNLYALQYANEPFWAGKLDASVIKIAPDGTRTTLISGNGLESATALTIGPDGAIYVANKGDRAGIGQVLRIEPASKVPDSSNVIGVLAIGAFGVSTFVRHVNRHRN
ncbi:hypothetical protein NIES4071_105740 (plasmid) [Calothrix sp. NIES-4071]|nr:hypothetical protein NIES4071_105740 [Calothrix sp. NIES-4071]BAZ64992.1 hypothetical protein NIES4105_107250 [Calothrix sp. NIES-4105]